MTLTELACAFAFTFCALLGVLNTFRTWQSLTWLKKRDSDLLALSSAELEFVILVPLLREQSVVQELLTRMCMLNYPRDKWKCVFITTARETGKGEATTQVVLSSILPQFSESPFFNLHCDTLKDTCKADQLNFALDALNLTSKCQTDLFVGIYDADSFPDPNVLHIIQNLIQRFPHVEACQQIPLMFQNVQRLPNTISGWYLLTRAIHNAYFTMTIELPEMRRSTATLPLCPSHPRRIFAGWMSHAFGHGEFFRLDTLIRFGCFSPPSCDTQLGHTLALSGIPIHPLPSVDLNETPNRVSVLFRQGIVWYNSVNQYWRPKKLVDETKPPNYCPKTAWFMIVRLIHSNAAWAFYPMLYISLLIVAAASGSELLFSAGLAAWGIYLLPIAILAVRYPVLQGLTEHFQLLPKIPAWKWCLAVAIYGFEKVGASLSALAWIGGKVAECIVGRSLPLQKTERRAASEHEH